jgi:uncharacterized protein YjbJ (UPF0337 family)
MLAEYGIRAVALNLLVLRVFTAAVVKNQISDRSIEMNTDQMKGKFKQLSGEIKRKWGQVTDDDLKQAQGSMEKLVGKIQERSGDQREAIEEWLKQQGMSPN